MLKGIQPGAWDFFSQNIIDGSIPSIEDETGDNSVVISASTAKKLGIKTGDRLTTHFLENNNLRTRKLTVTGIFETHFHEFDNTFAATPLPLLQNLNHVDSLTATSIEVRGIPFESISENAEKLNRQLLNEAIANPRSFSIAKVSTIENTCGQYLNWLDLLDTNVIVIVILMACVSGFTLISSLFIIILEHVNTIGLLKAIGATNGLIRRIFIYMAHRLVVGGIIVGNILAITLALIQKHYQILPLDPEAYYLNNVPIDFNWTTILIVDAAAILVAAIILILPSHLIARLSPATSLRYE